MREPAPTPSILVDPVAERLWVDGQPVTLRPKTWQVLGFLVRRSGDLVRKEELLDAVWPGTAVTEGTLNKSIGELRAVLEERCPGLRCIETVARRGFRWIGPGSVGRSGGADDGTGGDRETRGNAGSDPAADAAARADADSPLAQEGTPGGPVVAEVVARDALLAELDRRLAMARAGRRQAVFLAGEAGAGKTTVVDLFLQRLGRARGADSVLVAHGQCIETSGQHEAYRPVFEALERVVRDVDADSPVTGILRRFAPTWVAQMPLLASSAPAAPAPAGIVPGRMLRELATAVEEIARTTTVVVVLEDAHWADLATTDLLSAMARNRDPGRLLVIATMRFADAIVTEHPVAAVARDLVTRGNAVRLDLAAFGHEEVAAYLAMRCPGLETLREPGELLLGQTAGNPLFVRLVVDDWIARGLVTPREDGRWAVPDDPKNLRGAVPDNLRALLESQLSRLEPEERGVLEAASVRRGDFHAAAIAAATGKDAEAVDAICHRIVRRGQFLREVGRAVTADGDIADAYGFAHATVQHVVADGMAPSRRRRLHLAAAEDLERSGAGRSGQAASQLAVHYEAAGDLSRAMRHLREAARVALRRDAPRDAVVTLERVLELAEAADGLPGREDERLLALSALSHARQVAFGFVDPEVARLWSRTSKLAVSRENAGERMVAESGRIMICCVTARYAEAEEAIREALPLLDAVEDLGPRQTLFFSSATVRYRIAAMDDARLLFESALALESSSEPVPGADFVALLKSQYAPVLALVARPDEARRLVDEALVRARAHSHYSECVTATLAAWSLALLHDYAGAAPIAARALEIAEADGFRTWSTRPLALLGLFAMREGRVDEGIAQVRAGLAARRSDGQMVDHSAICCLFAEVLMEAGRPEAGDVLQEGRDFAAQTGERYCDAEFHRLRAKLLRLAGAPVAEVEDELRRAVELAALLGLHWHRLLAAADLASLMADDGRGDDARAVLLPALALVEGGAGLEAVDRARRLLAELTPTD